MAFWAVPGLLFALSACKFENEALTSTSKLPQTGPDCSSCHGYPLRDTNHVYHLFRADSNVVNNRPIACLHCHNRAMAGRDSVFLDSVFINENGNEFHGLDFPDIPEIRSYRLLRVESIVRNRPVSMPPRPGPQPQLREWMTAMAHMNGKVDVDFDASSQDTLRFRGARATFNPKEMTCSAMACHPAPGDYRWAVPSRNLSILKGDSLP